MNKVLLIGRVGNAPEVKTHEGGSKTTKFSLATTEGYGDKKEVTWHNITIWGEYGEKMSKFIAVGNQIGVEGRMQYGKYEKDGVKQLTYAVIVDKIELLDKKSDSSDESTDQPTQTERPTKTIVPNVKDEDGDLPF